MKFNDDIMPTIETPAPSAIVGWEQNPGRIIEAHLEDGLLVVRFSGGSIAIHPESSNVVRVEMLSFGEMANIRKGEPR